MAITIEDVARNPYGLFRGPYTGKVVETNRGLMVHIRPHDRNHLAGYNQDGIRSKWGLEIDPESDTGVLIVGQTVSGLQELYAQHEANKGIEEAAAVSRDNQKFDDLLKRVRAVQSDLSGFGTKLTTVSDLSCPHDSSDTPYTDLSIWEQAIEKLEYDLAWLQTARTVREEMQQVVDLFQVESFNLVDGRLVSNAGWEVFCTADALAKLLAKPSLALQTASKVDCMCHLLGDAMQSAGHDFTDHDTRDADWNCVLSVYSPSAQIDLGGVSFTGDDFKVVLLQKGTYKEQIEFFGRFYSFSSVDALTAMEAILGIDSDELSLPDTDSGQQRFGRDIMRML